MISIAIQLIIFSLTLTSKSSNVATVRIGIQHKAFPNIKILNLVANLTIIRWLEILLTFALQPC